jgi:hypothetical protein
MTGSRVSSALDAMRRVTKGTPMAVPRRTPVNVYRHDGRITMMVPVPGMPIFRSR